MNINEILTGSVSSASTEDQKIVLDEMRKQKVFDLSVTERKNLIDFLCEKVEQDLAIEYLFHVLDTEISYPIDDEKVKTLFSEERMIKMKDLMMDELQDVSDETESVD